MSHPPPLARPFVTMNVATGIDGKIAPVGPVHVSFGGAEDRALMDVLRAEADAVMIGAGTLRKEDPSLTVHDPNLRARRLASRGSPHPINIVVVSELPAAFSSMGFFREPETEKLIFTTGRTPKAVLGEAGRIARVEVVAADDEGHVDLAEAVMRLAALGVERLLLEGGGDLNFSMLRLGLIDEIRHTLCPFVFGGRTAPASFGGEGFTKETARRLELKSNRVGANGRVFLYYSVLPGAGVEGPTAGV
jgi:riboflavin-specific deaminase-like protein